MRPPAPFVARWAGHPAAVLLATLALMSVAILNGFPLVDSDSGRYILSSFTYEATPCSTLLNSPR